jgi:4-amino-4-deoxy-L-arabinose transferase-like glycosyltransferase
MALAGTSIFLIARRYSPFAAFYAAATFLLFHARNGIDQTGQRDFTITVLLLAGIALLLNASPRKNFFWFGLCIGAAATIKPTAALALPFLFLALEFTNKARWRAIATTFSGFLIPPFAAFLWLLQNHALAAFWFTLSELIPLPRPPRLRKLQVPLYPLLHRLSYHHRHNHPHPCALQSRPQTQTPPPPPLFRHPPRHRLLLHSGKRLPLTPLPLRRLPLPASLNRIHQRPRKPRLPPHPRHHRPALRPSPRSAFNNPRHPRPLAHSPSAIPRPRS